MREIKFRVWDKRTHSMHLVAAISFGDDGQARTIIAELAPKGKYSNAVVHGENGILMQYTGLKDCKGVEIYEGDIISIAGTFGEEKRAQVMWDVATGSYHWMNNETWLLRFLDDDRAAGPVYPYCQHPHLYEVRAIGNIYEHPDLLKGEESQKKMREKP